MENLGLNSMPLAVEFAKKGPSGARNMDRAMDKSGCKPPSKFPQPKIK